MKTKDIKTTEKFKSYSGIEFQILPTFKSFAADDEKKPKKYREIVRVDTGEMFLEKDFETTIIEKV